jgi:phage shock protein PspC (stress-responsive transcriptional regulator)
MSTDETDPTDPRPERPADPSDPGRGPEASDRDAPGPGRTDDGLPDLDPPAPDRPPLRERAAPSPADAPTAVHAAGPRPADQEPGLHRSATDRMLFGVCGGIAERYGFEPLLVRLAFVATLFIGGAGFLFYLAAAVLVPGASAPDHGAAPGRTGGPAVTAAGGLLRVLVALAVGIAALTALCTIAAVSFGTTAFLGAWPVAVVLLLLGGLLAVSSRSRRTTGVLLVLALALAMPATAAVLGDVHIDRTAGERDHRPATVARAQEGYRLGMGQMIVDLRDLPLEDGSRMTVPARVDVGQLGVVLPRTRCVAWTVRTELGVGAADVLSASYGQRGWTGGERATVQIDPPRDAKDRRPRVTVDAHVGVGYLAVSHSRAAIDGTGPLGRGVTGVGDDLLRTSACRAEDRAAARR